MSRASLAPLFLVPCLVGASLLAPRGAALAEARPEGAPLPAKPSGAEAVASTTTVLEALAAEIDRAVTRLRLADNEPPFFVSLQVKDRDSREIAARFGALVVRESSRARGLGADVRVGSYEFDSTPDSDPFGFGFDPQGDGYNPMELVALDDDAHALRRAAWLMVDAQYKQALASYLRKRGQRIYRPDQEERAPAFSREKPAQHLAVPRELSFDAELWSGEARRASARVLEFPEIFDSSVRVSADRVVRHFASSEGTRLVTEQQLIALHVSLLSRAVDGALLTHSRDFYGASEADLPRGEALDRAVREVAAELVALRTAPVLEPYTGPALLAPEATGVLFHETVGHRLEGDRQDDENEGRTFRGQIGQPILPPFVSVVDDPTRAFFALGDRRVSLNGHYLFDDQGVPAQPAVLVQDGILRGFLLSRRPVKGFHQSNGHGRTAGTTGPVARMANLIVQPSRTVPDARLRKLLLDEVRRKKKPYGILLEDLAGGNTNTSSGGYQAFKGASRIVKRIHAKDGREELVRGVEVVGTPLLSLGKIIAFGDRSGVFNGYCGAESGYVPVSAVAPAMLVEELELQRSRPEPGRAPLLPPP